MLVKQSLRTPRFDYKLMFFFYWQLNCFRFYLILYYDINLDYNTLLKLKYGLRTL